MSFLSKGEEDEVEGLVPALALASDNWPRTIDTFAAAFSKRSPPSKTRVIPYLIIQRK